MNIITILCFGAALLSGSGRAAGAGMPGGLIVCLGPNALESIASDWQQPGLTVHCLVTSDAEVKRLRKRVREAGCYGKVSVARFDGKRLPYIDNLVTQLIVSPGVQTEEAELLRVLAPYGVAHVGAKEITKAYPPQMDEWPQYLHGADNNCVSQDTVVGPPRHVQWISGPAWTRSHMGAATISSIVSAGGRLFTIEDTTTAENPYLPAKWKLIARDAFNGVKLWELDYPNWEQITVYIKRFHAQMQRRLLVVGQAVYCTPGLTAPVTVLEAATGKVLRQFAGTERTQEFVYHNGRLYLVIGDRMNSNAYGTVGGQAPKKRGSKRQQAETKEPSAAAADQAFGGYGYSLKAYNPRTDNVDNPTDVIVALDAATGRELWRTGNLDRYTGCTLALKGERLVYQTAHGVFCLNAATGDELWSAKKTIPYGVGNSPNTVVLTDEAVYSEEGGQLFAYALSDGHDYWGKSLPVRKGYMASSDILIAAGALWMCGSCNNPKGVVLKQPTAFDLKTGDELRTIPQVLSKPMGHDRCFRNFITSRFFINSKTGGPDCMDLLTGTEYPAPFTRSTCSLGVLPCNGLLYCGPWACQCHLTVALHNFNVYYTDEAALQTKGQVVEVQRVPRMEKGPVYGSAARTESAPWPTYRHDARRYAATPERVPATDLNRQWRTKLRKPLTAPTVAEGKVFVAETDAHTLHALDAATGKVLWDYVAGGRVDSPPTYYKGLLLFGSHDGWVHCVRAADGALSWRFKDLPDKLICAFGQVESAWPIHGSVLVKNDLAYFCAGRSSYLDGGLFLYALNPLTGEVVHRRQFYGPYGEDGFPEFEQSEDRSWSEVVKGTTADVMSSVEETLYIRHQPFSLDLSDGKPGVHLLASAGFLESHREHREYTLVSDRFNHRKMWTNVDTDYPTGDILCSDGETFYSVFGMPVNRRSLFDPRRDGYSLIATSRTADGWVRKWIAKLPLTGKAMTLTDNTVFVAGAPLVFDLSDLAGTYEGRQGGILWAASASDGSKLAQYTLDVLPAWDALAAGYGKLFVANLDGSVDCWGK